jgi:uncharacterized repeat protein (TIGR01451 family)
MCKFKIVKTRLSASLCVSGLIGLAALLPVRNALGVDQIEGGTAVTPGVAHVGNTITILGLDAAQSVVDNGAGTVAGWLIKPDNSFQLIFTNGFITPGTCASCPPAFISACLQPVNCVPGVSLSYAVSAPDVGQPVSFTIPPGFPAAGTFVTLPGTPHYVRFLAEVSGFSLTTGLPVQGSGPADVLIVNPSITVTKQCVTNCTPGSSAYGQPIGFTGTVCNNGDDTLINVVVTDTPPATITFATTTSFGTNGFPAGGGGRLLPGECVNFSGTYSPSGTGPALCGPFTDQVVASGTEAANGPFLFQTPGTGSITLTNILTVSVTNSATCFVCTTPCVQVSKNCASITPPQFSTSSQTYTATGLVTNCGNVPLVGINVTDRIIFTPNVGSPTTNNLVVLVGGSLSNGGSQSFTATNTVPAGFCGTITDQFIVTATNMCGGALTNSSVVCSVTITTAPCVLVSKNCASITTPPFSTSSQTYTATGSVTNCGNVPLVGVNVNETIIFTPNVGSPTTNTVPVLAGGSLGVGGSQNITATNTVPAGFCGTITDQFFVTATNICGGTVASSSVVCSITITTAPCVLVSKNCSSITTPPFSTSAQTYTATGSVTNCGNVPLVGVNVNETIIYTPTLGSPTTNTVSVLAGGSLGVGASQSFTATNTVPAGFCGNITDRFIVTATNVCGGSLTSTSAVCSITITTAPCVQVSKICPTNSLTQTNAPQTYTASGVVTNCGNVPLTGVHVTDTVISIPVSGPPTTNTVDVVVGGSVGVGSTLPFSATITVPANFCGTNTDQFTVTATNACTGALVGPATSQVCSVPVSCAAPCVKIYKQVICSPTNGVACLASSFSPDLVNGNKTATGVTNGASGGVASFCYLITVTNCSTSEAITNLVVTDDKLTLPANAFPLGLPVGGSAKAIVQASWPAGSTTNTVTVNGVGAQSGVTVSSTNSAVAIVKPISVNCTVVLSSPAVDMDGNLTDNHLTLPADTPPGTTLSQGLQVTVCNTGQGLVSVNVSNFVTGDIAVTNCQFLASDGVTLTPFAENFLLAPGACTNVFCDIVLGTNACPGPDTITVTVIGTAVATADVPCIYDSTGKAVQTAPSTCQGTIICQTPTACRTTGGGTLFNCDTNADCVVVTTVLSPLVSASGNFVLDHVSHGGQLGAPYNHQDCNNVLADPCIRGQWQHNRHYQGRGNPRDVYAADFHSQTPKGVFDTLLCACLGCCNPEFANIKQPNGNFTGWQNLKFQVCNPDDHKVCGPAPRPAPDNALIFSGIGTVTPATDAGPSKTANWVVFRVYIEDHSEPGGFHPKGSVSPADIYVFQAWDTGITVAKKADPNALGSSAAFITPDNPTGDVNTFRANLSADSCAFLQAISVNGPCPPGSLPQATVAGVTANVNDSGPLHSGNQQIHPSTGATCDTVGGLPSVPSFVPTVPPCATSRTCTTPPTPTPFLREIQIVPTTQN